MNRAILCATLALLLAPLVARAQQPVFRGRIDLVAVDVRVLDATGRPIAQLQPTEFEVTIDGRPRSIVSADFVALAPSVVAQPGTPSPSLVPRAYSSNQAAGGPAAGRIVIIVVDQDNIRPGAAHFALQSAQQFVDRLGPSDRVGIAVIPRGGLTLDPTTDRAAVRQALGRVTTWGIPDETDVSGYYIGLAEAFSLPAADKEKWRLVVLRECQKRRDRWPTAGPKPGNQEEKKDYVADPDLRLPDQILSCAKEVENVAKQIVLQVRRRTLESLRAQSALFAALGQIPGPKTVVMLSEELAVPPYLGQRADMEFEIREVGRAAARSQIMTYVLQLDRPPFDASTTNIPGTVSAESPTADDARMRADGLQQVVGVTGGSRLMVAGTAQNAFERLELETSGYYLLGVQTEAGDRDGKSHRIDVKVRRTGVDVRARREFSYAEPVAKSAAGANPTAVVNEMLTSGQPASELPLQVATYSVRNPTDEKLRVLISAEIDRDAKAPSEATVGFVLLDDQGKVAGSSVERATLTPVRDDPNGPLAYTAATVVAPGRYRLRLAVVDNAGRRGSVEHAVEARLAGTERLALSDIVIFDRFATGDGKRRPSVSATLTNELPAYLEIYSAGGGSVPEGLTVRLQVAANADGPALVDEPMETAGTPVAGRFLASGSASLGALAPGSYVARAVVALSGQQVGKTVRPIRIER